MVNKILILLVLCSIISCTGDNKPNYTYNWKLDVTYNNGDRDTVNYTFDSKQGKDCHLYLSRYDDECLVFEGGYYYIKTLECGVRKYEVISLDKVLIK